MMSDFRGGGVTKNWIIEGKNQKVKIGLRGGGGVKNDSNRTSFMNES